MLQQGHCLLNIYRPGLITIVVHWRCYSSMCADDVGHLRFRKSNHLPRIKDHILSSFYHVLSARRHVKMHPFYTVFVNNFRFSYCIISINYNRQLSLGLPQVPCTVINYPGNYRAMHFSAKRGIAIACRLSVRLSVCS